MEFQILMEFGSWFRSLSAGDILLIILVPLVIDFSRSIVKSLFLIYHAIISRMRPYQFDPNYLPKISLIIPAHNEAESIERTIEAAIESNYPNKEIIVVDDGSTDGTFGKALPYQQKGQIKLIHREAASGSKSGAINFGMTISTGDIFYVIDADTLLEVGALREATKYFSIPSTVAVSGNLRILSGEGNVTNLLTRLQSYEYLLSLEMGRRFNSIMGLLLIISGAFGGFRRKIGQELGLFDRDTITEDFDFSLKIRKIKGKLVFAPESIAWTFCPATWRSWIRQRRRWSYGQLEVLRKHGDAFHNLRFSKAFVFSLYDMVFMDILLLVLRIAWLASLVVFFSKFLFFALVLVLFIYLASELVIVVTAGILSSRKQDLKLIYLMPFVVLFYRPFYGVVRLESYLRWFLGKKIEW